MNDSDSTQRFSRTVDHYIRYRPGYPPALLAWMRRDLGLTVEDVIADIGSGTGKLTEIFLHNGNRIYGVEPNEPMRSAAEQLLAGDSRFVSVAGTAESTGLPEKSVDFVVAGQAFHWFDVPAFRQESRRILKPGGRALLLWNNRADDRSEFMQAYEDFLQEFSTDYQDIDLRRVSADQFNAYFGPRNYAFHSFSNAQLFDFEGLLGRYLSCSYALTEDHEQYPQARSRLKGLFQSYQENGCVKMWYVTEVYYGRVT